MKPQVTGSNQQANSIAEIGSQQAKNDANTGNQQAGTSNQKVEAVNPVEDAISKMVKMTLEGPRGSRATEKLPLYDGEDHSPLAKMRKTIHEEIDQHSLPRSTRIVKNHPPELVIGDITDGITTRKGMAKFCAHVAFLAQEEHKNDN